MKAILEFPENLIREAEMAAARNGMPLDVFVADAIQAKLGFACALTRMRPTHPRPFGARRFAI